MSANHHQQQQEHQQEQNMVAGIKRRRNENEQAPTMTPILMAPASFRNGQSRAQVDKDDVWQPIEEDNTGIDALASTTAVTSANNRASSSSTMNAGAYSAFSNIHKNGDDVWRPEPTPQQHQRQQHHSQQQQRQRQQQQQQQQQNSQQGLLQNVEQSSSSSSSSSLLSSQQAQSEHSSVLNEPVGTQISTWPPLGRQGRGVNSIPIVHTSTSVPQDQSNILRTLETQQGMTSGNQVSVPLMQKDTNTLLSEEHEVEYECSGFEIPANQALNTVQVNEMEEVLEPGHVIARSPNCTTRLESSRRGLCQNCQTTRQTYRRYSRTIQQIAREKLDSSVEDLLALPKYQLLHKVSARMAIMEKNLKEEKRKHESMKKVVLPPLSKLMRYLEKRGHLPESSFFYKFLHVSMEYWRRLREKGARGWVWDKCKHGTDVLKFFMGLRKLDGGRRACLYLAYKDSKTKTRASGPIFEPGEIFLPIPPVPTLDAHIALEKKSSQSDLAREGDDQVDGNHDPSVQSSSLVNDEEHHNEGPQDSAGLNHVHSEHMHMHDDDDDDDDDENHHHHHHHMAGIMSTSSTTGEDHHMTPAETSTNSTY